MSKTSFSRTFCVVVDTPCRTYGEWIKEHDAKVRADYAKEIDMDRIAYHMGRTDGILQGKADGIMQGRAEFEPLINLLVSMETDVICEEMSTTDYCEQNCKYDCPQKECYLRYLEYMKEQKNEQS